MVEMIKTEIGRLRLISMIEGLSWLALLSGMFYRFMTQDPTWVSVFGRVHGGLFVLFVLALLNALLATNLGVKRAVVGFVLSLIPLGAFVYEWMLRKDMDEIEATS